MKIFTYEDYLKYSKILQQNKIDSKVNTLKEPSEKYELMSKGTDGASIEINNKYDKTFKTILENKEELLRNLNKIIPRTSEENKEILLRIINHTYKD